jgi:hypothetical protein
MQSTAWPLHNVSPQQQQQHHAATLKHSQQAHRHTALRQLVNVPVAQLHQHQQQQQQLAYNAGFPGPVSLPEMATRPQAVLHRWNTHGMVPMQAGTYTLPGQMHASVNGGRAYAGQHLQELAFGSHPLLQRSAQHGHAVSAEQVQQTPQSHQHSQQELQQRQFQHQQRLQQQRMMMSVQQQHQHQHQHQQTRLAGTLTPALMPHGPRLPIQRPGQCHVPHAANGTASEFASVMIPSCSDREALSKRKLMGPSMLETALQPPAKKLGSLQKLYQSMQMGRHSDNCPPFSL